jgi:hypothetical protein
MTNDSIQATLDRILADLKSDESERQLAAIHELERIKYSSEAIVTRLEQLAIHGRGEVKSRALAALSLKTSQFAASKAMALTKVARQTILKEIMKWQMDGLIELYLAEAIRRRYDFDIHTGTPIKAPSPQKEARETGPAEEKKPMPSMQPAASSTRETSTPPAAPRPGLMQSLLSEFSIRIYLYLGAFFVIVAAAILAALVEAARLPILLIATLAFAGGAVGFKRRLPQPSFAFAIVFSFLLPIDGVVIADSMNLTGQGLHWFWFAVYLAMAGIWAVGVRLYVSRLFSIASFAAFTLGIYRLDQALDLPFQWIMVSLGIASLAGLVASRYLIRWKGQGFAFPNFLAAQGLQAFTLAGALLGIALTLFDIDTPDRWVALALTWLLGASFYAASGLIVPFLLFPWAAVASLFLVPWLFLSAFDASPTAMIAGIGVWAAFAGLASELVNRASSARLNQYQYPFLVISLPLFLMSILWGFAENAAHGFFALLGSAVLYTVIHAIRPRWYAWTAALIAGLGAYFTFFVLPLMMDTFVYFGIQLLIASLLLLIPELFFKEPFNFNRPWNWPPVALGTAITAFNLLFVLTEFAAYPATGEKSIVFGAYALVFAAYAWRFNRPLIGYLATGSTAVSAAFALTAFELDLWLPALTVLSAVFFGAGYFLSQRERGLPWGAMLIHSSLALGTIISLTALFTLKPTGGWYALLAAILFAIELFTRRNGYLELFVESLLSVALIIVLNDFEVRDTAYYLFGVSLVWLACDSVFHTTLKDRKVQGVVWLAGGSLTFAAVGAIVLTGLASGAAAACFAIYAAFFAAYAWTYKQPLLGCLSTAGAAAAMFYALDHFEIEIWLPIFTALALTYYLAGFLIRNRAAAWSEMFRFSGLGLGSLIALAALILVEPTGGWYALIVGAMFTVETVSTRNGWFEAGVHVLFSVAAFLILRDFEVNEISYTLLALSLVWLGGDAGFFRGFKERKTAAQVQAIGLGLAFINGFTVWTAPSREAVICYGVYAFAFALYALLRGNPTIGYLSTISLPLAVYFGMHDASRTWWIFPVIGISVAYYGAGYFLRNRGNAGGWETVLLNSGPVLGTITSLLAPFQAGGIEKALPITVAATLFAVEAFARRSVWLAFPANALYLISYFTLLVELNVEQPQYFSIGAALLGMAMHYLLVRANSKTGAFVMGTLSQLTLLGTTYIQMVSTERLGFFFVLFAQSLLVLVYGIVMRSRSLVLAPIGFAVLGTITVLYSALRGLSVVVIVGVTGIVLLALGILAVLMRERITTLAERFSDWNA